MKAKELTEALEYMVPDAKLVLESPDGEEAVGMENVCHRAESLWITSRSDYPEDPEDEEYILQTVADFTEVLGDAPDARVLLHRCTGPEVTGISECKDGTVILKITE